MDIPSGILLHAFRIPVPGVQKKVIYHFSDIHLTLWDSLSGPEEVRKAKEGVEGWNGTRSWFANHYGEPDTPSQHKSAPEHFSDLLNLARSGDALVMAGDICDYVNGPNLRCLEQKLEAFPAPWLAVCGNHDLARDIPEGYLYSRIRHPVQVQDLGDLLLVGLDDSQRTITPEQNRQLQQLLTLGKPMILVLHIPIMAESNRELLLSCGEYFRLNHSEADAETLKFIDLLQHNTDKIAAVLAGHLHFHNECEIAPGLIQYVSSQGILGNINRYELGE